MPRRAVFLYNSGDRPLVRAVFEVASPDLRANGYAPWMDHPPFPAPGGLTGTAGWEEQIRAAVADAAVVFYCLGPAGPGPWQADQEAPMLAAERARREAGGEPPLAVIPVLFDRAEARLPDWATRLNIANKDRRLVHPGAVWRAMRELLARGAEGEEWVAEDPDDPVTAIFQAVALDDNPTPGLTLFVGPYALGSGEGDDERFGPAQVAQALLAGVRIGDGAGAARRWRSLALWPSEAAEWLRLDLGEDEVRKRLRACLSRLEGDPPELARAVGELALCFHAWRRRRPAPRDWCGLLLLTTRIDLALERRLHDERVPFTRYLPTVKDARQEPVRRKFLQEWDPALPWVPEVPPTAAQRPSVDRGPIPAPGSAGADAFHSMEDAAPVVLVKLCGALDVPQSLVHTTSGFLTAAEGFRALPRRLLEFLSDTPQVLLGRGFASPLLQLIRREVLGQLRADEQRLRVWVMPNRAAPGADGADAAADADPLCALELELLERNAQEFPRSLGAVLHREDQPAFARRLAGRF